MAGHLRAIWTRSNKRARWYAGLLLTFWNAGRLESLTLVGVILVSGLAPTGFIVASGTLIGSLPNAVTHGLGSSSGHAVTASVAALAVLFGLQQLAPTVRMSMGQSLARRVDSLLQQRVMAAVMSPPGIAHLEDPVLQNRIGIAAPGLAAGMFTPGSAAGALSGRIATALRIAGATVLLLAYHWWLALGLLAMACWYGWEYQYVARKLADQQTSLTKGFSRANYYRELALSPEPAKEIQVFDLGRWLGVQFAGQWEQVASGYAHSLATQARRMYGSTAGLMLAAMGAYLLLGWESSRGLVGLGEIAVYAQAIYGVVLGFANAVGPADATLSAYAAEGFEAADAAIRSVTVEPKAAGQNSEALPRDAIRFEDVRFRYSADHPEVLSGLSLTIPAGRSLAIVGANGAGKTTLIKLLCRFYEPTSGRITIDGHDLAELDLAGWRHRMTAVFQDFVHYPMTAYDNVTLGSRPVTANDAMLARVAERAMATDLIDELPRGWATLLSKEFSSGVDLSGGQWQRIALARALLRAEQGAGVLILDEPTAALDVRAEAELYERFLSLTSGLTSIVISHRFSTVRQAQHICVVSDGALVEEGSHDELMELGARYATMFRLQAARFESVDQTGEP
ncbi:MAG: ABC transporter ATP-binding protein [Candidatus Dormibacteraceae bacterium]